MKKTIPVVVISILLLLGGLYYYYSGKGVVVRISEPEIISQLNKKLPLTKTYFFIIEVTLKNPRVTLVEGSSRVKAGIDVVLNIKVNHHKKPLGGTLDVSSGVKYVSDSGEFYLTDPIVESLGVQGIPEKHMDKVNKALSKMVQKYYEEHPIYTLRATDLKKSVARMVLKNVVVEDRHLVISLGL
jgi:hypothetical protein